MQITPAMLDKDALLAATKHAELGLMNVEEAIRAFLNALLASGKAEFGNYAEAGERVLIIRLNGEPQ